MPRSRTDITESNITPSTDSADAARMCWRRLVAHHVTSVFDEFYLSLFDFIQLARSLRQSEIDDESTLTLQGRHVISKQMWCHAICPSISWMRSKVYKMNSSDSRADPCSTPHSRRVMSDRRAPRRPYCVRPTSCDRNYQCALSSTPKVCCRRCSRMTDQRRRRLPLSRGELVNPLHLNQ